jgi:hypothetical protein
VFITCEEVLWRGVSSQSRTPMPLYTLGVDIGRGLEGKFDWMERLFSGSKIARGS